MERMSAHLLKTTLHMGREERSAIVPLRVLLQSLLLIHLILIITLRVQYLMKLVFLTSGRALASIKSGRICFVESAI